jgi:Ala-tRNA(Pro) deacylase
MISPRLKHYLEENRADYRLLPHPHTASSMWTAQAAHVPGDQLAKAIVLADPAGTLVAVIPADYYLDLPVLRRQLRRNGLELVEEVDLAALFPDCEPGAVPPLGPAYGVTTIWDTRLGREATVYLEAGDHETLIELSGRTFHELMAPAERGRFSHHA